MTRPIVALALILAACGGSASATTTTSTSTTVPPTTTAATTSTTVAATTTTTTLIDGPVDVLALAPYPLLMSSFGPSGVGPVPGSGLTMALAVIAAPSAAPGVSAARGGAATLIGVFGAAAGFDTDCLGFILWTENFSSRHLDGYVPLTPSGCGDPGGPILPDDRILLLTDRTLVVDLGPVPGGLFAPAFQVQDTAGDAGLYSIGQDLFVDPATLPVFPAGLILPFGGELFDSTGFATVSAPEAAQGGCVADESAICLLNNRFRVEATGAVAESSTVSVGFSVPIGTVDTQPSDEGAFSFIEEERIELVVKAVDGCMINGEFWFSFWALRDLVLEITVTDTLNGDVRSFEPAGGPAEAITDTQAFATCP